MRRPCDDDQGYATVYSTAIIAAAVTLALVVAGLVSRTVDSHRAQVAADLAAVSGATALYSGAEPCATAHDTAQLNSAEATSCQIVGQDVIVAVRSGRSEAAARAGPL